MTRTLHSRFAVLFMCAVGALSLPVVSSAQARVIRVVSSDGKPIAYANVSIEGGITQITDEKGDVPLGAGKRETFTVRVRRIGFTPWFGKLEIPDTAATLTITLPSVVQKLSAVTVAERANVKSPLALTGFYDRWLMRQKGVLSAQFISPEELEFRHPDKISNMLYGLNGVRVSQACVTSPTPGMNGRSACVKGLVAFNAAPCGPMAIVIDGMQQRPVGKGAYVDVDALLDAYSVAAIEVYPRGGNMPVNFQFQDMACGVLAFWTGSRRP